MKPINNLMLKDIADKLMLELNDVQVDLLLQDIALLNDELSLLDEIEEMKDISPMTFPFSFTNSYLREDVAFNCISQEEVLKNAKRKENGHIVIPKVI